LKEAALYATLLDERLVDAARAKTLRQPGPRFPKAPAFLEVFSGCGALTAAMVEYGFRVAPPFDRKDGEIFDVPNKKIADVVVGWIRRRRLWMVWLAPPCTSWSLARSCGASGAVQRLGLRCAHLTVRIIEACFAAGVPFVVENSLQSKLWEWSRLRRALRRTLAQTVDFDMCAFGPSYKKPT
jgi:hypothetical protein